MEGMYSATTTTFTLTRCNSRHNGYRYRAVWLPEQPRLYARIRQALRLLLTPQPTVTLTAAPYTRLLPGEPDHRWWAAIR